MRVLMLGWEFPPAIEGGLGTACYGLTRGLAGEGAEVTFVLPHLSDPVKAEHVRLVAANPGSRPAAAPADRPVPRAYETPAEYVGRAAAVDDDPDLLSEVDRYAVAVERLAREEPFDVIHAHDWMTWPAGLRAQKATGRPLVCHVHSTEFDRCGDAGHAAIADIERRALNAATEVITVSGRTRHVVVERYGVDPEHIVVIHNAIDADTVPPAPESVVKPWEQIVVFLGRLAFQKGPDYFIEAAARALSHMPEAKFVLAGRGGMLPQLVRRVAELRCGKSILFAGFLDQRQVGRILSMADLYVMTSVHEPFGIAPLEAMAHGVPVIIPRTAGVSEVVANALRVDFWDVDALANRIVSVLRHAPLRRTLGELGRREVAGMSWREPARRCLQVYQRSLRLRDTP